MVVGFGIVTAALIAVFRFAEWRADTTLLTRYCDSPEAHVARVGRILMLEEPVEDAAKRPYIVAAKLIYLVPRRDGEGVDAYLRRLLDRIGRACR